MNNDDWLSNLASSLGLESGTVQDHSVSPSADINPAYEYHLPPVHDTHDTSLNSSHALPDQALNPHAWHQLTTRLNDGDDQTSSFTSVGNL